jgi:hypothetical protein
MLNLPRVAAGDGVSARWLNRLVDVVRSLRVVTDGSILVDHTPGGQVLRVAASGGLFGQITTACPARSGTAPNFTYGKGAALLYKVSVSSSGVATTATTGRTVDVYNYLNVIIPVRSVPVALEYRDGILCVDGGDCIS